MPRKGYTWSKGNGWIKVKMKEEAKYDGLGDGWPLFIGFMRAFPDFVLDLMRSPSAEFELSGIQRVFLRANARYQYVDITACRGATKSYCIHLGEYLQDVLYPGVRSSIYGPSFKQTAAIAGQIFKQIQTNYPALTKYFVVESASGDRFALSTQYNSRVSIEAFRGNTIHRVTAEEIAQESPIPFNTDEYKEAVIPSVRGEYKVNGKRSNAFPQFAQHTITSAGRRQSYAYENRKNHMTLMARGESAFVVDVPYDVILLEKMRPVEWAKNIRQELTGAEWIREMESVYSGSDKNPIVRDEVLTESRNLVMMEEHHCCKDRGNKFAPEDVIYIVGYDVAYRDSKVNAKCACVVLKCTKQMDPYRKDRYRKQAVWVEDWPVSETQTPIAQARRIKKVWARYCFEGSQTYLVIDSWQYGDSVLTSLMDDLGDGLAPLCVFEHRQYTELEREGAVPVIYPIKAGGVGTTDPDSDMVLYMEQQFENGNIQLLVSNMAEGVESYKKYHRIKETDVDWKIALPYKKTGELVAQIQNLREEPSGMGIREKRISMSVQRDSWSALKYAGRMAQLLERSNLQKKTEKSDWTAELNKYKDKSSRPKSMSGVTGGRLIFARKGGRLF